MVMRKIFLIVGVLLLLGGAGGGAYYYFFIQNAQASVPEGQESADIGKEEHTSGKEEGEGHSVAEFVELDPLILPVVDNSGVNEVVSLVIAIEVGEAGTKDGIKAMSPRLKDAYIQELYGIMNKNAAMKDSIVQVAMIKQRLNAITQKVLGEKVAKDVLLQVVQQRPI